MVFSHRYVMVPKNLVRPVLGLDEISTHTHSYQRLPRGHNNRFLWVNSQFLLQILGNVCIWVPKT